jgi:hypothetical protein
VGTDGSYEIQLDAPGAHSISVGTQEGTLIEQRVVVEDVAALRLDFELGTAAIEGRVLDARGSPVAGAQVELAAAPARDAAEASADASGRPTRYVETDGEGAFAFARVVPGRYSLSTFSPRGRSSGTDAATRIEDLELARGERIEGLELRLAVSASIDVLVEGPSGPLAGLRVHVVDAQGRTADARPPRATDAEGRTRIEGLAPGSWFVRAVDEHLAGEWSGPIEVAEGAAASARIDLGPGAMLHVSVTGASKPGTELVVRDARGFELARAFANASSSADPVVVGPLPFGRFTLRAEDGAERTSEREVVIQSAESYEVAIELGGE